MSHDLRRRGSCSITIWICCFISITRTVARDVTAKVVGSGALLGGLDLENATKIRREERGQKKHKYAETEEPSLPRVEIREQPLPSKAEVETSKAAVEGKHEN
jgi:hypothetical protein